MKQHLNTLFVTTQGAYLAKDGQAVAVRVEKQTRLRVPLHNLGGIVCFGRVGCSPALMGACGKEGVAISFLTEYGGFLARVSGFTPGNVLLRREQYRAADRVSLDDESVLADSPGNANDRGAPTSSATLVHAPPSALAIARNVVAAKIANSRTVLLRAMRDRPTGGEPSALQRAVARLGHSAAAATRAPDLDTLRGVEGEASNDYFAVFNHLMTVDDEKFRFTNRSRRPPLDPINALMSFLYSMLTHDARAACEAAGLDPAVGFLHRDRPGRPGLALDLIEEFRAWVADRMVLSLINRRQVRSSDFQFSESGSVTLTDEARKTVLTTYQKRKQQTIVHPFLEERTTVGLLVHLQARLLARYLRGDLDAYPAFIWK